MPARHPLHIHRCPRYSGGSGCRLPGFIGLQHALNKQTDKRQALQQMEALNMDTLPVVQVNERFAGIVDRSRLTASLLIDVANNLEKK